MATDEPMDERLKQLMDYTKFHIGMYTSLATLLIGVLTVDKDFVRPGFAVWLLAALIFLVVAGMAGGMVGSSIPEYTRYADFVNAALGPWGNEWWKAPTWIHLEHTAFWLSITTAVIGAALNARI